MAAEDQRQTDGESDGQDAGPGGDEIGRGAAPAKAGDRHQQERQHREGHRRQRHEALLRQLSSRNHERVSHCIPPAFSPETATKISSSDIGAISAAFMPLVVRKRSNAMSS